MSNQQWVLNARRITKVVLHFSSHACRVGQLKCVQWIPYTFGPMIMHIMGVQWTLRSTWKQLGVHYTAKMCIIHSPKCVWASPIFFWENMNQSKGKQWKNNWSSTFVMPAFKTHGWFVVRVASPLTSQNWKENPAYGQVCKTRVT
jgi:hypothetical protein